MFEKDDVVQKTLDQAAEVAPGKTHHQGDGRSCPNFSSVQAALKKLTGSDCDSPKVEATSTTIAKEPNEIAAATHLEATQRIAW